MSHHDGHRESFTDGVAVGAEARAAHSQARSGSRLAASRTGAGVGQRLGLGGLLLLVVPLACCGRSSRACCKPGMTGWAQEAQTAATRRPPAR